MKKVCMVHYQLLLLVLISGCGMPHAQGEDPGNINSSSDIDADVKRAPDLLALVPISGQLFELVHKTIRNPETGMDQFFTDVSIEFQVGCVNELGPISHLIDENADKSVDVVVSAYEKVSRLSLITRCASPAKATYTVALHGHMLRENIHLGFTVGDRKNLPEDLLSLKSVPKIQVISVEPMCAPSDGSKVCFTDGTKIVLETVTTGCLDDAAFSFATTENDDGKLELFANGINIARKASENVFCLVANTERYTVNLIDRFYEPENVLLKVVR